MLLKYKNLIIRNATTTDVEQLAAWWNDGKIMVHAGFPNGAGQTAQSIADSLEKDTDDTHRQLIIEIDNVAVGEMNYRNKSNGVAEIGIKICDFSKQNKGNGKIILSMLIYSLFNDLEYNKIILDTNLKNKRSQHVYEKLGFRKLRINKNSWTNQMGELQSSIDYELYPSDFNNFLL
ncbi:GNAT family N-acetyltransferase [Candidatus Epulonipiscioides gigas]|nr:GNAT family N-acetyltransferase [Epulopiscium sp. SCG-C07WGA-EpuloA2]